jgi:tripeptide aminopeptidase
MRVIKNVRLSPQLYISNGGLDANWMTAHGLPTVTLGAGQMEIHTVDEKLDINAFYDSCRLALMLATGSAQAHS